jgi:hypothetical protein
MTNLVVCCDGTWNTPAEMDHGLPAPTNVVKLSNALVHDEAQSAYYHPGVGTGRNWWSRLVGGGTGEGLDQNIMSAYRWLAGHYRPGDRIFLFGFSRGAYTVRSLGGLITKCGLLDLAALKPEDKPWPRVDAVFAAYRKGVDFANPNDYAFHNAPAGQPAKETTPIHFIGVWDTVGALGIPDDLPLLGLFEGADKYRFHDTALSRMVANARHAVALDEKRASFAPTLWSSADPTKTVLKQLWFPGVHGDVGGGYFETALSDGALAWMMAEAEACGLKLRPGVVAQLAPNALGIVHDSCTGVFKALRTKPRTAPPIPQGRAVLHDSTLTRNQNPPLAQGDYWPTVAAGAVVGNRIHIYAAERWNFTGLYLEAGRAYEFKASGEWVDGKDRFSPAGHEANGLHLGDVARAFSSGLGEAETTFKVITGRDADFWWTRRVEQAPWFALIGYVANPNGEDAKTLATGETFSIGEGTAFTPKFGGYLHCYANDAWQAYANNRGSVVLTVTKIAPAGP